MLAVVRMMWPHSNLGDDAVAIVGLWHSLLERFDAGDVEAAVRELAASGREHAPPVGLVVKTLAERATDAPEWDETWSEVHRLIARFGSYRVPPEDEFSHPIVAAFARPAWRELCMAPAPGTGGHGTHEAQQREAYKAMRARLGRDGALVALGAPRPGSRRRLEALEETAQPRRVGPRRPDYLRALSPVEGAA